MLNRPKILILFEGIHLAYSPTVIQLYESLDPFFEVLIFAKYPEGFTNQILPGKNVQYYKYEKGKRRFFFRTIFQLLKVFKAQKSSKFSVYGTLNYFEYMFRFRVVKKLIRDNNFYRLIAVDHRNLYYCSLLNVKCDFLSLELCLDEDLFRESNLEIIDSVIIQSKIRYQYLFGEDYARRVFFIQNAPTYKETQVTAKRNGFVFTGTAFKSFGIDYCLNFIKKYKTEKLFVFGNVPAETWTIINSDYLDILSENRLIISTDYLTSEDLSKKIGQCEIGFCFYDFSIAGMDNINYKTAPSGKLFMYLSAGVPVIANDIDGFQFVRDFKCGELIKNITPEAIDIAVDKIRVSYNEYVVNAKSIAKEMSFDKKVKPYVDLLVKNKNL
jgi:glycosyltransferase involved in cell wall biosynthesis